mgnify:CR=1 FL=1
MEMYETPEMMDAMGDHVAAFMNAIGLPLSCNSKSLDRWLRGSGSASATGEKARSGEHRSAVKVNRRLTASSKGCG